jgi:hypothetical protein
VDIVAYIDESGTHDPTGKQKGSEVPVVSGYMASREEWIKFCGDWKTVLDKYKVPYFHFREFNDRDDRKTNAKSPYYLWDEAKAESFKYDLAEIAGRHVPIGGMYNLEEHTKRFTDDKTYPYTFVFVTFFRDLNEAVSTHYPRPTVDISFVFDQKPGEDKWASVLDNVAAEFRKKDSRIGKISFADKKDYPHWPLQAADMIAFRTRRLAVPRLQKQAFQIATVLDIMLQRNLRPNRRFRPTITPALMNEMLLLCEKHSSVKRALDELTWTYFALKNERRFPQRSP